jgi:GT2 family glycosyltransferase
MNLSPKISLVVPTYQRRASVERLLQALAQQSLQPEQEEGPPSSEGGPSFEVIVVSDGSSDGTRELVEQTHPPFSLQCIEQINQGRAAACNRGIRAAQGELVVLLDDDMDPSSYLLEEHWNAHRANPRLGVLGAVPIQIAPSSPPVMQFIAAKFNQHLDKLAQPNYTLNLRDFYSGNFSIWRDVLLEVGLFDENFKIYGNEDLELAWRLKRAGVRLVYNPAALAFQHYEKDYAALARDSIAKGKTSTLLAKIHPEVLPEIKLSTYRQESKKWRLLRGGLLSVSRFWKPMPQMLIRFMTWLERRHPAQLPLYYRLSLDYFYWLGVNHSKP